ncbi:23S rRNA (cytidine(2498)-2'-O)-methyltransferase RlmM [Kangiella shandongensis]|uniref:23S rRNA (cytidine(2498)-2'-O)-methyltransferase RlmM n=1 Tax=Kangiella shandongensis TaxID=2763258 RepID=UPI001CC173CC|nr:23S rRNA (cytidine(2498)-2'-O)-methyltransferase RlmM [Kangiella shandongensis]
MQQAPFVFFCRPGFESDCAAEVQAIANACELAGYANAQTDSGYVRFFLFDEQSAEQFFEILDLDDIVFARQWFWAKAELEKMSLDDRISPIIDVCTDVAMAHSVLVEHLDSNEGRELSKFCKKFSTPLTIALEKQGLIHDDSEFRLHVLFIANDNCLVGYSPVERSSAQKGGILRLKAPKQAPSRSTLKLDEAIQTLMSRKQQHQVFRLGNTSADLGAAPGGWTYQLVERGLQVAAIDNGPMDKKLMATEQVEHFKENAFSWLPEKSVDVVVCDMVEKPSLVANLMATWLEGSHAKHAIFNLKLPMKKRFQEVADCIGLICERLEEEELKYHWQAKHLYHDREEITVYFRIK